MSRQKKLAQEDLALIKLTDGPKMPYRNSVNGEIVYMTDLLALVENHVNKFEVWGDQDYGQWLEIEDTPMLRALYGPSHEGGSKGDKA